MWALWLLTIFLWGFQQKRVLITEQFGWPQIILLIPFNGSCSDLTGRLLRPKTSKNNLIAAALIPEHPFRTYKLACLKTWGFLNETLIHLLPDVAGQYCWDLQVYPVFCNGGDSFSGMSEIICLLLKCFTEHTFYLTVGETVHLFVAPSSSV